MLIIDSKDCENIDKALKKYKKKFEKSKTLIQLRERQSFTKPSIKRRGQVLKAIYKQQIAAGKIDVSSLRDRSGARLRFLSIDLRNRGARPDPVDHGSQLAGRRESCRTHPTYPKSQNFRLQILF